MFAVIAGCLAILDASTSMIKRHTNIFTIFSFEENLPSKFVCLSEKDYPFD